MEWAERYGPWAIVSGASSGIGRAFAQALAARGLRLVLVARRAALLEELAAELAVETLVVPLDLSQPGCVEVLAERVGAREVGLLVLNAGTGTPGRFPSRAPADERALVELNCLTPLESVARWLDPLRARGHGGLILTSSAMAFQGVPFMAHYAATKAYLLTLGEALFHECRPEGVDVLALAPGATDTPGKDLYPVDYDQLPIRFMEPARVVEEALAGLGRVPVVVPGFRNRFLACIGGGFWTRNWVQRVMHRLAQRVLPAASLERREGP